VADACDKLPTARERAGVMLQGYNKWADQNGEKRLNASGFHDMIENSSDPTIRNTTGGGHTSWVQGLALKTTTPKYDERE
jgi:hypothetical protein